MESLTSQHVSAPPKKGPRAGITIVLAILGLLIYCGGMTAVIGIAGYNLYQRDYQCPDVPTGWDHIILDNFESESSPGSHWIERSSENKDGRAEWDIRDGMYFAEIQARSPFFDQTARSNPWLTDFYLKADVQALDGSDYGYSGVLFHYSDGQGYYFIITASRFFSIWLVGQEWTNLVPWTKTRAILPDGSNQLAVFVQDSRMVFCINNQRVREMEDTTLTKGYSGFVVGLFEQEGGGNLISLEQILNRMRVAFDNFSVYIP
jgi:hypothetical protein